MRSRNERDQMIKTTQFQITGNLLQWDGVAIQISNISDFHAARVKRAMFPWWALALFAAAVYMGINRLGTIPIRLALGIPALLGLIWWGSTNERRSMQRILHIRLNSGGTYSILFESPRFLNEAMGILTGILKDGTAGSNNYFFDLKNCQIDNNSSLIHTMKQ